GIIGQRRRNAQVMGGGNRQGTAHLRWASERRRFRRVLARWSHRALWQRGRDTQAVGPDGSCVAGEESELKSRMAGTCPSGSWPCPTDNNTFMTCETNKPNRQEESPSDTLGCMSRWRISYIGKVGQDLGHSDARAW